MDVDGDAVPYSEFVALARDEGLVALEVHVVQAPSETNGRTAVVQATARAANAVFSAIGEASPRSASEAWHPFLTTLAEMRAKARALRDLTGLDHPVQEELSVPYVNGPAGEGRDIRDTDASWRRPAARAEVSPAPHPAAPGPRSPATRPAPVVEHEEPDGLEDDNADGGFDDDDEEAAAPGATIRTQTPRQVPPAGYDSITPDTVAKLKRIAVTIAELEGAHLSDADVQQRLDDFFMRAFKHPLSRATRIEGQRALQHLSEQLARRRRALQSND